MLRHQLRTLRSKLLLPLAVSALAVMAVAPTQVQAQSASNDKPVEIEADNALVWDRAASQYKAIGNAVATQGDMQVKADNLVADYREVNGKTEIWRLTAENNVTLTSGSSVVTGQHAVYNIPEGKAVLTGNDLRLRGENGTTVTAKERFEYWTNERKAVAVGDAELIDQGTKLRSNIINAWLADENDKPKANGQQSSIKRAETAGQVTIITDEDTVTADKGRYDGIANKAYLDGNVKLDRPPNVLTGARAEIDMTTKLSKLFAAPAAKPGSTGRVKGVFYPEKKKDAAPVSSPVIAPQQTSSASTEDAR